MDWGYALIVLFSNYFIYVSHKQTKTDDYIEHSFVLYSKLTRAE